MQRTRTASMRIPDVSDVATWPASKINAALDRLDKLSSANTDDFINAGRGHERPSEYLRADRTDPLSRRAQELYSAESAIRYEINRRYGPGAPSRLPRGFGPIKAPRYL